MSLSLIEIDLCLLESSRGSVFMVTTTTAAAAQRSNGRIDDEVFGNSSRAAEPIDGLRGVSGTSARDELFMLMMLLLLSMVSMVSVSVSVMLFFYPTCGVFGNRNRSRLDGKPAAEDALMSWLLWEPSQAAT